MVLLLPIPRWIGETTVKARAQESPHSDRRDGGRLKTPDDVGMPCHHTASMHTSRVAWHWSRRWNSPSGGTRCLSRIATDRDGPTNPATVAAVVDWRNSRRV